jgi:lysophospholipase L1-like esterase
MTCRSKRSIGAWLTVLLLAGAGCSGGLADPPASGAGRGNQMVSKAARIVFLGDSITEAGVKPGGYVKLVENSLHYLYPEREIEVIGAGKTGNRVPHLLARFRKDVLPKAPTHVVVYVGVNDVGRGPPPGGNTGLKAYRNGLADLVKRIEGAGADAIVCTPGVIGENPVSPTRENRLLDQYAEASREVAANTGAKVCDLRAAFTGYLERFNPQGKYRGILTLDGIHLNAEGNRFVARQIVHTFSEEFKDAEQAQLQSEPYRS